MNPVASGRVDDPPKRRTRARRGEGDRLRTDILDAFDELLRQTTSVEAISVRSIADAVGVTPPSIYLHFPDKDALVFAACNRHFLEFRTALEEADDPGLTSTERLRRVGRAYCRWGMQNPEAYRVMFMERRIGPPAGTPIEELHGLAALTQLFEIIQTGVDSGEFVSTDVTMIAMTVWGGVHGVVALAIERSVGTLHDYMFEYDAEDAADVMLAALIRGMHA